MKKTVCIKKSLGRQQGAVLVVSLVILLVLTILGVSVMNTTTLQEKMAAATRDKDLAFQSAEAALSQAEVWLAGITFDVSANSTNFTANCNGSLAGSNFTTGLCSLPNSAGTPRWESVDWVNNALAVTGVVDASMVSQPPKIIVEHLKTTYLGGSDLMVTNIGEGVVGTPVNYFRVTAMGYGGTENSQVMLQSTFGN